MNEVSHDFKARIEGLIRMVPEGSVTTYGDLASLAGSPRAARIVGGVAHYGDQALPWHRLVNRYGGLASGFHGGREVQAQLLANEGVQCTDHIVDSFDLIRWKPEL